MTKVVPYSGEDMKRTSELPKPFKHTDYKTSTKLSEEQLDTLQWVKDFMRKHEQRIARKKMLQPA